MFVCVITAPGEMVETVEAIDVPSDGIACDRAMTVARAYSRFHGYQIWRGGRKIAAYYAPQMAPRVALSRRALKVVPFSRRA